MTIVKMCFVVVKVFINVTKHVVIVNKIWDIVSTVVSFLPKYVAVDEVIFFLPKSFLLLTNFVTANGHYYVYVNKYFIIVS